LTGKLCFEAVANLLQCNAEARRRLIRMRCSAVPSDIACCACEADIVSVLANARAPATADALRNDLLNMFFSNGQPRDLYPRADYRGGI
jgi:hypothetical protein